MADSTPDDGPSLEMPSFSIRRRRKADDTPQAVEPTPEPPAEPTSEQPARDHWTGTEPSEEPGPSRRATTRPAVTGLSAAAVTGVVVGGLAVLLAWLAGLGCSEVRGTSSCGGAAGLPLLLAALVVLAWVGAVLLRFFAVREAGSTSLLAVGILAVLVLIFLLGSLDEWWSAVAVPVASVAAYALSWWVTTAVSSDEPEPAGARPPYDVR